MMNNEHVKRGLSRAGVKEKPEYKQGFHLAMINNNTSEYDMMRHPDRKQFELNYFLESAGNVRFTITNKSLNKVVLEKIIQASAGENIFEFDSKEILNGKQHVIKMITPDNKEYSILTKLR
jgi:hypothetical protein